MSNREAARALRLQRKHEVNSLEILDAAAEVFSERGYAATSIDNIADVLGCTKGRVYYYFKTKGEVFIGINHRALTWALEAIVPAATSPGLNSEQRLREMVRRHALHMMEHSSYTGPAQLHTELNLAREGLARSKEVAEIFAMRRRFERHFTDVVEAGMADGTFRVGDVDLMTKAMFGSVNWMSIWFRPGSALDVPDERERAAVEFSEFAVNGLLARQSRKPRSSRSVRSVAV